MIKITIVAKKRALDSEFEKLRCALEDLKRVIYEEMTRIPSSMIRKMRKAGLRGAKAGRRLRRILNKK